MINDKRKNPLSDELIITAYYEVLRSKNNHKTIYVAFDDLYKHLRANHIKWLTLNHFKDSMKRFWNKDHGLNWGIGKGSSIRREVRRYSFDSGRGLIFYICNHTHIKQSQQPKR